VLRQAAHSGRAQALEAGGGGKNAQALRKLAEAQAAANVKRKGGDDAAAQPNGGPDPRLQARPRTLQNVIAWCCFCFLAVCLRIPQISNCLLYSLL